MCRACIEGKRWKKEELWGVEEEGNGVGKKGGRGEGRGNGSIITGYGHSTNRPGHHGTMVAQTVGSNASYHSHSLENATHLAGTGVQVLIYMGQMQPASSSIRWSVDARCDSHTDFHLQQKIEYKSGFHGNDYKKVVYLV